MDRIIFKLGLLSLCFVIPGCSKESAKIVLQADTSMSGGNYCSALDLYKKAASIDPDLKNDQKVTTNTFFARKECAKAFYRKGTEALDSARLDDAIQQFKTTLQIDPEHKKARQSLEDALNRKDTRLMTTEDLYQDGLKFMQKRSWQIALTQFRRVLELDKNHQLAQQKIDEVQENAKKTEDIYSSASALLEAKKYEDAIQVLDKVLAVDPAHAPAQERKTSALGEIAAADDLSNKGMAASDKGDAREAIRLFTEALKRYPEQRQARENLAKLLYRAAEDHETRGNIGNAVLALKKVVSLKPGFQDAEKRLAGLEEEIRQRASCNLALLPFKEYGRDPELSDSMYASVRKKMGTEDKGYVRIVDNRVIEKVLQEKDLPLDKAGDAKHALLLKEVPGLNAVLTGKVVSFKISAERKSEKQSKEYQSGTNRKRNPDYDTALQNARLAEMAAKQAKNAAKQAFGFWGGVVADIAGGAVEISQNIDLANTPEYIEEPVFSTWNYKIITHKKKGELVMTFRLVDTQTGEPLAEESIPAEISFSGETIENPNPAIGIPEKSLPSDSDFDLREAVIKKATEVISEKLSPFLQKYAYKHLVAGKKFASGENRVQAVENYLNFMYAISQDNKAFDEENKKVREYLESVDLCP